MHSVCLETVLLKDEELARYLKYGEKQLLLTVVTFILTSAAESCMEVWVLSGSFLQAVLEHDDFLSTDISQGSVAMYLRCGGPLITILPEIYWWIFQWKNFENQLRFDAVTAVSSMSSFLEHSVLWSTNYYTVIDVCLVSKTYYKFEN